MPNLNITLRPLILLPLVAAMLTACGGGGSSSSSTGSTTGGGSSTTFNTSFSSSLVITDSNGIQTNINNQSDQSSFNESKFSYGVISDLSSNIRSLAFSLNGYSTTKDPIIRVYFDINTQAIKYISYDVDENSSTAPIYSCSPNSMSTSILCNNSQLAYDKNTGTSTIKFTNQKLLSTSGSSVKLNGQLTGKIASKPVDVTDLNKTSLTSISVNNMPTAVNSATTYETNATGFFNNIISLTNGASLQIVGTGYDIEAINYSKDDQFITFQNISNAVVTTNSNSEISINLNNIYQDNVALSGNITTKKPVSSLKIDGSTPEAYGNVAPGISHQVTAVNSFKIYDINLYILDPDQYTETDFSVVVNGNSAYGATVNFIDGLNGTESEYACDPSGSQICKGITVSSNGNQINFNNTVLYRQNGSSMTKSTITVSGSFNTQGR